MKISSQIQFRGTPLYFLKPFTSKTEQIKIKYSCAFGDYTPAYCDKSSVSFCGTHDPSKSKMGEIYSGLNGFSDQKRLFAPKYFAKPSVSKDLLSFIRGENPTNPKTIETIMQMKTKAANFQAFFTNKDVKTVGDYKTDTLNFLSGIKENVKMINKTIDQVGLSPQEAHLLYKTIAETSPILFTMGFGDAIPHAAQVSRKCMIETFKQGGSKEEILQAGLIGWLHDPKFPLDFCWNNLATHPIIAGSLAYGILNKPENRREISLIFNGNKEKTDKFINGITETLFINNDSAFVMNKVILHKIKLPHAEEGMADWIKISDKTAQERLLAPSQGKKPAEFSKDVRKQLQIVSMDTGISGISIDKLELILRDTYKDFPELKNKTSVEFLQELSEGLINDKVLLNKIREKLEENHGIISIRVPGDNLFCHHQEVKNAKLAAKSLIIADPMLLSPYKIVLEGTQNTALGRILSFCDSFNDNVKYVALEYKYTAKNWQKKLYESILKSADELTGTSTLSDFQKNNENTSLDSQIKELFKLIKNNENWGIYANISPADNEQRKELRTLARTIKKYYDEAAENSPEMFGV